MDKKLYEDYLETKKKLVEFYSKAIKKLQKIDVFDKEEESIKKQFIEQLKYRQCFIRVEFPEAYEKFVERIEEKLRRFIYFYEGEEGDGTLIRHYRLHLLEDMGHYYDYLTCACSPLNSI
jgi:hypothetical protein